MAYARGWPENPPYVATQPNPMLRVGLYTAYGSLALAALGLPVIVSSDSTCRLVGSATQDYTGSLSEPGYSYGLIAFTIAPLIAVAAIVFLAQARREGAQGSKLAIAAAILVFPLAALDFLIWVTKSALGCGLGFL